MIKTVLFFLLLSFTQVITAQSVVFQWARQFSGTGSTVGVAVTVDASGNVYTVGNFQGTVDFDPGPGVFNLTAHHTFSNGFDVYISKLDAAGNFVWAKQISGLYSGKIALDASNNIYLSGVFNGTVDFDPGPGIFNLTASSSVDLFICKLDAAGGFIWAKYIAGVAGISGIYVSVMANGNVYANGTFKGTSDFDPGAGVYNMTAIANHDLFILKLDAAGNFIWAKQCQLINSNDVYCIATDVSGNVYTTGDFNNIEDFDPGAGVYNLTTNGGAMHCYVLKLDANGNFVWARSMGGMAVDAAHGIAVDGSGNVFTTGYFLSTADFDPGPGVYNLTAAGLSDIFVSKLDVLGNFVWAKRMGGPGAELGFCISVDANGNVYTSGTFNGTADFDPGPANYNISPVGNEDIFITRLNSSGNFVWAKQIAGTQDETSYSIATDALGNIYTTGEFTGTTDFDPGPAIFNLISIGSGDAFIHTMSQCTNSTSYAFAASGCNSYTLNGQTYTVSGIYVQTLINAGGCDSTITLDLTLSGSNDSSVAQACDNYTWNGQTYTVSGFYRDTLISAGGCDSILNLDLTIKYKTATFINAAICQGQNYADHMATGSYIDNYIAANGCDSVRTLNLTVNQRTFSNTTATICQGQSYWGHILNGVYKDTLTGVNGCDSVRTLNLTVNPSALKIINAAICEGQSYFAGGANQTLQGLYYDTLKTALGCDSIITTNLSVWPKPNPDLGPDRNLCLNAPLSITPGSFNKYQWQDNSIQPNFTISNKGKYWVTVTDANSCTATDTLNVLAIDTMPKNFLPANQLLCYNSVFNITLQGYKDYLWSTGETSNTVSLNSFGSFYLTVTDNNNCVGKDTILLQRNLNCIPFSIPNAFTPNKDGKNDIFKPIITQDVSGYSFTIFNNYGQKIFETNISTSGWDGTFKGTAQPRSSYVYMIRFKDSNGFLSEYKGMVTLIR